MKYFLINNLDLLSNISLFLSNFTSAVIVKMYMAEGKFGYYGLKLSKLIDNLTFLQLFIILFTFFNTSRQKSHDFGNGQLCVKILKLVENIKTCRKYF